MEDKLVTLPLHMYEAVRKKVGLSPLVHEMNEIRRPDDQTVVGHITNLSGPDEKQPIGPKKPGQPILLVFAAKATFDSNIDIEDGSILTFTKENGARLTPPNYHEPTKGRIVEAEFTEVGADLRDPMSG